MRQRLVDINKVAKMLDCSPAAIRMRLVRQSIPPGITRKLGKRIYFDIDDLESWLESCRRSAEVQ